MKKTIRNKELLVGVIFLIVGVAYFALAFTIPSYDAYGGSSVVDSSFVPKVIGALMTVLSVLQLVFSLRAGKNPPPAAPSAKPTEEDGTFKVEDWDDDAANRNADTHREANTDCNAAANDRSNRRDRHTRHGRGSRLCS